MMQKLYAIQKADGSLLFDEEDGIPILKQKKMSAELILKSIKKQLKGASVVAVNIVVVRELQDDLTPPSASS